MLVADPGAAVPYARRAVQRDPEGFAGRFVLGAALRRSGALAEAEVALAPLTALQPTAWGPAYEQGMVQAALGNSAAAIAALERATALNPQSSLAWHALGDQCALVGRGVEARTAHGRAVPGSVGDPALVPAVEAVLRGDGTGAARAALQARFGLDLNDVAAVRLIADVALRRGQFAAAVRLLTDAVAIAPDFAPARFALALALHRLDRGTEAAAALIPARQAHPDSPLLLALHGAIQQQLGDVGGAVESYETVLRVTPDDAEAWHAYGHALRALGRQKEAVAAYRQTVALAPERGEAWWSLANLKTVRLEASDLAQMQHAAANPGIAPEDRAYLDFALGKALEDERRYAEAFDHYARGNAVRKRLEPHDAAAHHRFVIGSIAGFDAALFARHATTGCTEPGPIFVVGMPRSGSTLVEQILASHSEIEGLSELPTLTALARGLATANPEYPESVGGIDPATLTELGRAYLDDSRVYRTTDRPLFVDKFPGNFLHAGLIHLMMPNARIIDVRRDARACCFSLFKQAFARGQAYSYDLGDLAHYYRDYVALMAHFDAVLPGRVHRVHYEQLVEDPERQIGRMLAYCGLALEPQCLRFFETERVVRTPSSEQVRQPIFRDGLDQWQHFEPWLSGLTAALGPLARDAANRP